MIAVVVYRDRLGDRAPDPLFELAPKGGISPPP
ncbi:MAG: hypothetical protein JWM75_2170, partial [Sphingomonas bacterium]|nr:hypothetical protein [Sphingomonas bacterium]